MSRTILFAAAIAVTGSAVLAGAGGPAIARGGYQ